jgi:hypothetical protein
MARRVLRATRQTPALQLALSPVGC